MEKIHQFEIIETLGGDSAGAIYRARDSRTGDDVALRKFLPFRAKPPELNAEEQVAYQVAIKRLLEIRHASLRPIIAGNCDPIDGMPYIVAKWSDATPLQSAIEQAPLSAHQITALIRQALEVCALLSNVLAEEAVWVETDVAAISIIEGKQGQEYVFWVSPISWLSRNSQKLSLSPVVELAEMLVTHAQLSPNDHKSSHIITWLEWMKGNAGKNATIHEAREILAASAGIEGPAPIESLVENAKAGPGFLSRLPHLRIKKFKQLKMPLFVLLCFLLIIEAFAGWIWVRAIHNQHNKDIEMINRSMNGVSTDFLDLDDNKQ